MSMTDNETSLASLKKETFFKTEEFEDALEIVDIRPLEAAAIFEKILSTDNEDAAKFSGMKEDCIIRLAQIYASKNDAAGLGRTLNLARAFFPTITKPRSAKVLRSFLDEASASLPPGPNGAEVLIPLCIEAVAWAEKEKRTFLRHRIQVRLASLYLSALKVRECLNLLQTLTRELKKLDDKPLIVEVSLLEAKAYMSMNNIPRAKSSLTTARANSAAFYCPVLLQAEMDSQAGEISAAEGDFKTAYSYFYEAFEAYSSNANISSSASKQKNVSGTTQTSSFAAASIALRRMVLCKIMDGLSGDVHAIVTSRAAIPYASHEIQILEDLVAAQKQRSVKALESMLSLHAQALRDDPFLASQVGRLRDDMLEKNLLLVIEPYSRVELSRLASILELPQGQVEAKVAELILDSKIHGVLDQETGDLVLLDEDVNAQHISKAVEVVAGLEKVVDKIAEKMASLSAV